MREILLRPLDEEPFALSAGPWQAAARVVGTGRCAHTIVVQNGKIMSIDWVTYYPGKQ